MRLVMDSAAMVAALRSSHGASRVLLLAAIDQRITLLASVPLMFEYEAVLTRPEHLSAANVTIEEINAILDAIAKVSEPVKLNFQWRPALRDPDDDMVLEAAVNGNAEAIVTFNVRDFHDVALRFGVEVLTPGEALKRVEKVK
jgi:putative PIN family toxin of toxin-antitoxin system